MCAQWAKLPKGKVFDPSPFLGEIAATARVTEQNVSFAINPFLLEEHLSVLAAGIDLSPEIPDSQCRGMVWQALVDLARAGQIDGRGFLARIAAQERSYLQQVPQSFYLLTSLSVEFRDDLVAPTLSGCTFRFFRSRPNALDQKPLDSIITHTFRDRPLPRGYAYLRIATRARTPIEAAEKAIRSADFYRALWNLYVNLHRGTPMFSGRPEPVNEILPGPFSTLHDRSGTPLGDFIWYEPGYVEPARPYRFDIWPTWVKQQSWMIRKVRQHKYRSHMEEAIRRYGRALDDPDYDDAILRLWSLLEKLTNTIGVDYDQLTRRASFWFADAKRERLILEHLRQYRNRSVHFGHSSEIRNQAVHQLRRVVERGILFHLHNIAGARSIGEAAHFLDLPLDRRDLRTRRRLLNLALKYRR